MKRSMMYSHDEFYYPAGSAPYGESYGQWTVRWWQWLFSIPKITNPLLDTSGIYSDVNQPSQDAWFLVGKMPDGTTEMPCRSSKIPGGRSILFPVINCEANPFEYPELKTEQDIIDRVKTDEDTIVLVECIIDGKKIPAQRVESDPRVFKLEINKDNAFDIKEGVVKAAADGFWVFLQPLEEGEHEIFFHGSCEFGKLNSGAQYHLQILRKE